MSNSNGRTTVVCPISTKPRTDKEAPKGWSWKRLDSVARLESGHTPSRKVAAYWDGGDVPWLSLKDIRGLSDAFVLETVDTPTMDGINNSSARILPKDTVAFCRTASVGNVAILGRDMATSQDFVNWVCSDCIDPKYLYWALKSSGREFEKEKQGATHKTIYMPTVKRFHVLLPPLSEQKRIAGILDKADAIRRKRQQAIGLTEQFLRSTFLDMFGDPVTNPKGWPVAPLKSLIAEGDKINYGVVQPGKEYSGGIPVIRVGDFNEMEIDKSELKRIDPAIDERHKKSRLTGDEILVACVGSIGLVAVADESLAGFNIVRAVARIRCSSKLNRLFLACLLSTPRIQSYFKTETRTVSQPTLNIKQIEETQILVPPIAEQNRFSKVFERRRTLIRQIESDTLLLDNLFNSLVQRAFRGEL